MKGTFFLLPWACAARSVRGSIAAQKLAFAHVVVGNTAAHTRSAWENDIIAARAAGLDAFALNGGYPDPHVITQIDNAFAACEGLANGFRLFLSFDYLGGGAAWPASEVVSLLQTYESSDCYLQYDGKSFVSTFEGTGNTADWAPGGAIRSAVDVYLVPDWTSLGPAEVAAYLDHIDGFFSWDLWPDGAADMTEVPDREWIRAIGSNKTYMMGVSPWFFHSASAGNRWLWRGDDLWADRWNEIMTVDPQFVEIVTWNDWGESSYIGPFYSDREVPPSSSVYVDHMPHDSFRAFLPYYIATWKSGACDIERDQMQYWYRLSAATAGSECGVHATNPDAGRATVDVNTVVQDRVFFSALLRSAALVAVQIGDHAATWYEGAAGINHWSQGFDGQTGAVTFRVVRDGVTVQRGTGAAVTASTSLSNGCINYNVWAGDV